MRDEFATPQHMRDKLATPQHMRDKLATPQRMRDEFATPQHMRDEFAIPQWLIVLSGFFCCFLGTSIPFVSGIIHLELLAEYGQSDTKTAWSGSLCNSMFALAGR